MIEKITSYQFFCDGKNCTHIFEGYGATDLDKIIEEAEAEDWQIIRKLNCYCPDCRPDEEKIREGLNAPFAEEV